MQPIYIEPGYVGTIVVAYSEAAMYMRVAGRVMRFKLTENTFWPMVQLFQDDGRPFSAPITTGEAGVYTTADGRHYFYPAEGLSDGHP